MVDDDNRADGNLDPEAEGSGSSAQQGARRSTWAPPFSNLDDAGAYMSDDDLAQALENNFDRAAHTGTIPIIHDAGQFLGADTPAPVDAEPVADYMVDDPPLPGESDDATHGDSLPFERPDLWTEAVAQSGAIPIPESERAPEEYYGPAPVQEPEPESQFDSEPRQDAPSVSHSDPPARRSVPTAELAATLSQWAEGGGDPNELMTQLEDQVRLREQDVTDFRQWQQTMVADGSAEALAQVEFARQEFGDILDNTSPKSQPAASPESVGPSFVSHTFRNDAVLESDLLNLPAPMTAPVANVPPPADYNPAPFFASSPVPPAPVNPTPITSPTESVVMPSPEPSLEPEPEPEPEPESEPGSEFWQAPPAPPPIPDLVEPLAPTVASDPFDFDSLISGNLAPVAEEQTVFSTQDAQPATADPNHAEGFSGDDQALAEVTVAFPGTSDGIAIVAEGPVAPEVLAVAMDSETPEVFDEVAAPFEPVSSSQMPIIDVPLLAAAPSALPVFRVEESSGEPTATDQRVGRASRLFWLWFAANSSIVSIAFGGAVLSLGMSLRQAIVATLVGVSVSFLPLGLGTLAGKWSGQPTMVVSRATFGHFGNILPAVLAIVVRVFWGAVLLWFLAAGTARILTGAELTGSFSETQITIIGLAVGFLLSLVIAFFGYGLIARIQMVFTIISALLIAGLIVITWPAVNIPAALTVGDGPWILVLTGAVLVFSFVGLVWAVSSADLARYQRASGSGASSMLWSTFGATIPAFVLITYGAVLAASSPDVLAGLLRSPLDTIATLVPIWYPIPLIAALAFSLLSGVVISIYSGGFALQATGASVPRSAAVVIIGVAVAALAILIAISVGDFTMILRDVATSIAVPIAAWAGIFGAEMMIRSKGFVAQSLMKRGGVYSDYNWVNVSMLIVASAIGFGLTTATVSWLGWQGFLFGLVGVPLTSDLAASDLGVFVALIIGLLTPIIAGIPGIRRQEAKGTAAAVNSRGLVDPVASSI